LNTSTTIATSHAGKRSLIVGFGLIASIVVVATPFLAERGTKSSLQRAVKMISSNVHLARQKAMAAETNYRISYDYQAQHFRVYREERPGQWVLDPPENFFLLPQGVHVSRESTPANGAILISASGEVTAGDEVLLKLSDDNENRLSIRVSKAGNIQEFPAWR
jgi:hypothetical protein